MLRQLARNAADITEIDWRGLGLGDDSALRLARALRPNSVRGLPGLFCCLCNVFIVFVLVGGLVAFGAVVSFFKIGFRW